MTRGICYTLSARVGRTLRLHFAVANRSTVYKVVFQMFERMGRKVWPIACNVGSVCALLVSVSSLL